MIKELKGEAAVTADAAVERTMVVSLLKRGYCVYKPSPKLINVSVVQEEQWWIKTFITSEGHSIIEVAYWPERYISFVRKVIWNDLL